MKKPHAVGGKIPVIHFSDAGVTLKSVDPKKMRTAVCSIWEPKPMKAFFFVKGSSLKAHGTKFDGRTKYTAQIDGGRIYDATGDDPLGFFATWPIAQEKQLVAAGYRGVLMTANNGADKVLISYDPIKVKLARK